MTWKRTSKYSQSKGPHSIAAYRVRGEWVYLLWHGKEILGRFETAEAAREFSVTRESGLAPNR